VEIRLCRASCFGLAKFWKAPKPAGLGPLLEKASWSVLGSWVGNEWGVERGKKRRKVAAHGTENQGKERPNGGNRAAAPEI
jgi:hypothetical protein